MVALDGVVNRLTGMGGGGTACNLEVTPSRLIVGRAGETTAISVTAPAGCSWTATSTASWIAFPSGTTGTGSGTVTVSVPRRSGWRIRTGAILIGGQTIVVFQR